MQHPTDRIALAGTRNSSIGPNHEGSISLPFFLFLFFVLLLDEVLF